MFSKIQPLEKELSLYLETLHQESFGKNLNQSKEIKDKSVLLLGLLPSLQTPTSMLLGIRKKLYSLFWGDWNLAVTDLGNYCSVRSEEDKFFFNELLDLVLKTDSSIIFLGDGGTLNHHIVDLFIEQKQRYNLSFIDSHLMLDTPICHRYPTLRNQLERDNKLFLTSSIGLQTYYNSLSDMAYANKHFYQVTRLGDLLKSVDTTEPLLRQSDILSVNIANVVQPITPAGLDVPNLCAMFRYAGMGCVNNLIMFQGLKESHLLFETVALSIWYYIEGFTFRSLEDQSFSEQNFEKYLIASDPYKISFYRSLSTDRWWISLPYSKGDAIDSDLFFDAENYFLIPCSQSLYEEFCHENLSKRVLELYRLIKKA